MGIGRGVDNAGPNEARSAAARVFISYAHDDASHEDRVRDFWLFLREQGVDARADLPAAERRQDWAEWMTQQVRDADRVLVVASPEYRRRAEGAAGPGEGRGVQWEARLIRDRFYADQKAGLQSIVPVVLPGCSAADIPLWMGPEATTHYLVSEYTVTGAEKLLRLLTGQPWEIEPPLGTTPVLPPRGTGASQPRPPADAVVVAGQPGLAMTGDQPGAPGSAANAPGRVTASQQRSLRRSTLRRPRLVMAAVLGLAAGALAATLSLLPGAPSGQQGHAASGSPVVFTDPHGYIVAGVAFSPDGKTLAVVGANSANSRGNTLLWDIADHMVTTLSNPDGFAPGDLCAAHKAASTFAVHAYSALCVTF